MRISDARGFTGASALWLVIGVLGMFGELSSVGGAEEPTPAAPRDAVEIPPELRDSEFETLVDLAALGKALRSLDRRVLVEQAERMVAAESRVGRPHHGVSAEAVIRVLLRALVESRDLAGLNEVEAMLKRLGKEDLLPSLAQARKLMAAPRKLDIGPDVPVGEVSAEAIVLYNTFKDQIRVARVIGDADVLRELKIHLGMLEELHPKQRGHLARLADDSLAALPARPNDEQIAMSKLVGYSGRGKSSSRKK